MLKLDKSINYHEKLGFYFSVSLYEYLFDYTEEIQYFIDGL